MQPSAAQKHDLPCGIESDQSVFLSVFPHDSSLSLFVFFHDMTYWLTLHSMNYTSIAVYVLYYEIILHTIYIDGFSDSLDASLSADDLEVIAQVLWSCKRVPDRPQEQG